MPYVVIPSKRIAQPRGRVVLTREAASESHASVIGSRPLELVTGADMTPISGAKLHQTGVGIGYGITVDPDKWESYPATVPGTVSASTFTIEIYVSMTRADALANIFGLREYNAAFPFPGGQDTGKLRSVLAYPGTPGNIYFWGAGADLDSSTLWSIAGAPQHVFITATGGVMSFYRAGRFVASGVTPAALLSFTLGQVIIGSRHASGTGSSTFTLYKGAVRNRAFSADEIVERTKYPWMDFAVDSDKRYFFGVSAAGGSFQPAWARGANTVISTGVRAA
jgi:hypothetical protein